ncbi:uncharacterized protein [Haliotis asinina]|uniref:uncharacterized protein n=1 Tax=Haliotis asinina TaxID=109174 RepID=UPI0035319618
MEHQVFRKFGSPSLYECVSECLTSSVCRSFAFQHKTQTCFLNNNSSAQLNISLRSGFDFSDIQQWTKALIGPCAVVSCPSANSCHVDRHGRATCVPEFTGCGHPPHVPFASVTYDGHYMGAVATYACEKDYTACHQGNTSVCQASGEWENVTSHCCKFRWRNTNVNGQYHLPCGPQSKFNVLILATPNATTRCSVNLWAGEDVTFHSDFRFTFGKFKNVTVINAKFRHRWGKEMSAPQPLTVGEESEIQISLSKGVYMLVVDGSTIIRFHERQGVQPDRLYLSDGFTLRVTKITV